MKYAAKEATRGGYAVKNAAKEATRGGYVARCGGYVSQEAAKWRYSGGCPSTEPVAAAASSPQRHKEPAPMPRSRPLLLVLSRELLNLNQERLAKLVGSSKRSVQRWENARSVPMEWHVHTLADAVRPHDAQIAAELDAWAPRPPPPAPPPPPPMPAVVAPVVPEAKPVVVVPPPPPLIPLKVLVDSVVCAAAEAMGLLPNAVRPALLAAFARAHEARLTPEEAVSVLAPPVVEVPVSVKGRRG